MIAARIPVLAITMLFDGRSVRPRPDKAKTPGRGPGVFRQAFRTALPTLADLPDAPVEVLAHDAAITTIGITIIISVAAIAGTVVTSVVVAPARANADADANRARAYPNALRVCRHRHRDPRRCEKSDGKFLHIVLLVATLVKTHCEWPRFLKSPDRLFRDCEGGGLKQKIVPVFAITCCVIVVP